MKKTLLAACLLASIGNAHALLSVDTTDANFGVIPGETEKNEFLDAIGAGSALGCFGCQLLTDVDTQLTFDFFGSEAGFNNLFSFEGDLVFNTGGDTDPGGVFSYPAPLATAMTEMWANSPTYIPFSFTSPVGTVENGANPVNIDLVPNFFLTIAGCFGGGLQETDSTVAYDCTEEAFFTSNEYWLFFDDAGGAVGDDDNHDDMVVRITAREIVKVPEASTVGLLGMGLAMMGFVARRRV